MFPALAWISPLEGRGVVFTHVLQTVPQASEFMAELSLSSLPNAPLVSSAHCGRIAALGGGAK